MPSSKHKRHSQDGSERHSRSGTPNKKLDAEGTPKSKSSSTKMTAMDLDSPSPIHTPSRRKSSDTHGKTKAELLLEKSPTLLKTLRDKGRSGSPKPGSDHSSRTHASTPSKSPSTHKSRAMEVDSEDEDEAFEKLRAQGALELEKAKSTPKASKPAPDSESDSDDDAPVAKSFKEVKHDAMEAHQQEQEEIRAAKQKEKEKRRQRTQLMQEQSKATQSKKKEKEKRRREMEAKAAAEASESEDDLLPTSLLKHAISQSATEKVMELDEKDSEKRERKRKWKEEQQRDLEEKIESKRVTVVPLTDSSGAVQMQSRKAAAQSAEAFLKEHFWGGRLERMPAEHYLSERIRGPALQFIVPNGVKQQTDRSMKSQRRATQSKRRRS